MESPRSKRQNSKHIDNNLSLKMDDEEDIAAFFLQVDEVVNSLKVLGETVEESTVVQKFLRSLLERFDSKVSAIEEMKDLDSLKTNKLHGILIAYEMRKGIPKSKEAAFKASRSSKKGKSYNYSSDDFDITLISLRGILIIILV